MECPTLPLAPDWMEASSSSATEKRSKKFGLNRLFTYKSRAGSRTEDDQPLTPGMPSSSRHQNAGNPSTSREGFFGAGREWADEQALRKELVLQMHNPASFLSGPMPHPSYYRHRVNDPYRNAASQPQQPLVPFHYQLQSQRVAQPQMMPAPQMTKYGMPPLPRGSLSYEKLAALDAVLSLLSKSQQAHLAREAERRRYEMQMAAVAGKAGIYNKELPAIHSQLHEGTRSQHLRMHRQAVLSHTSTSDHSSESFTSAATHEDDYASQDSSHETGSTDVPVAEEVHALSKALPAFPVEEKEPLDVTETLAFDPQGPEDVVDDKIAYTRRNTAPTAVSMSSSGGSLTNGLNQVARSLSSRSQKGVKRWSGLLGKTPAGAAAA